MNRIMTLDDLLIIGDVWNEIGKSIDKHGVQVLPDGTSKVFTGTADAARADCKSSTARNTLTWKDVIAEEFWEAMAETEWSKLRPELVQCMAVIFKWIKDGDAR